MTDSINLRHFPATDPPSKTANTTLRERIEREIAEYLANGKAIQDVGTQSGIVYVKRTRKAQVNFMRRKDYKRPKQNK